MRIAVCSSDMDERYALSRRIDNALLRRGVLPEISMFPMLPELIEASAQSCGFDMAVIPGKTGKTALSELCRRMAVILVGGCDGADAFEVGAAYFIENPENKSQWEKALTRCLSRKKEEITL